MRQNNVLSGINLRTPRIPVLRGVGPFVAMAFLLLFTRTASAAIGIDVTASTDRSTKSTTIASPAFSTTSGNELLLAFISADYSSGTNTTVTGVSGASLTWTLAVRSNKQSGTAEIWQAFAPATLSGATVTATLSQSGAASMTVMSFTGVNPSGAVGATASSSASSGAPTATLTTTQSNSLVLGVGDDWDNAIERTLGSGQTSVHQYLATVGDTYWVQRQTNATALSGTSVTINDTAPTTDRYNLSIVEVLAAAGTGTGPASIAATGGASQSATIGSAFGLMLQATVKNSGGTAVSGVTVTFAAPSTGASGTFTSGNTAVTDTNGVVNVPFQANSIAGSYSVTASVSGVSTPATFALTNLAGLPASIAASVGTPQSAAIGAVFATALQAIVKDASGNPVSGVPVTFTAPAQTAASGLFGTATMVTVNTTAAGVATASAFTANNIAGGPYVVTASYVGAVTPANFSLTNTALPPGSITVGAGSSGQTAMIGTPFSTPLQVTVKDTGGNLMTGVTVTFTAPPQTGASGTFSSGPNTALTNGLGVATISFTANSVAGSYNVTASVSGLAATASFSLTNTAGPAASITATAGVTQIATVNTAFATALQATVKDASGNPVSGVTVTFSAPTTGPSGSFAIGGNAAQTNSNGVATAGVFTANGLTGAYTVTAAAPAVTPVANFNLTNNAISISALSIDASVSADGSKASSTIATPSFSTNSGNELLLALVSTGRVSSPNTTVTRVAGAGLTWVLVNRTNAQNGDAEIWRAFSPTPLSSVAVTATLSESVEASISVISFTGVDTSGTNGSGAIGATGSGNSPRGVPTASLTTTRNNSWVFGVGSDVGSATSVTLGTGQTLIHQYLAPVGDTYWMQRMTAPTPLSGTSVTINDTAPGTHRYNLDIVEVLPASPPTLSLSMPAVSLSAIQGSLTAATFPVTVSNIGGGGALSYTTMSDSAWLGASASGTTPGTVQISASAATLSPAVYTGHISVAAAGAQNSPVTITVTFTVAPPPTLSLSTSSVSLSAVQGGANPAPAMVNVTNSGGGGALSFTASTDSNSSAWLSVSPSIGTTSGTLAISAKVGTLTNATYTGYVTVTSAGALSSPATITVTFTVGAQPVLSVSTTPLSFSATQSGVVNPTSTSVGVANTGSPNALNFTATSDSVWLNVSPGSGSTPYNLQISASLGILPVGLYNGNITVTAAGAQGSPKIIPVSFAVTPILGDSNLESVLNPGVPGQAQAFQAIASATGSVNSLVVYLDPTSAASQIFVGIYQDNNGQPGTLLSQGSIGQGASSTLPSGWNNVGISSIALNSGTPYWIALLGTQGGIPVFRSASGPSSCPSVPSTQANLALLPPTWSSGAAGTVCPISIYAMAGPDISGTISGIPAGAPPTVVTLSGAATQTTTADASGNYAFGVQASQTYQVTPGDSGYTFTPANQTVNVNASSVAGVNFNAQYSISGNVGVAAAGVTVYLSGQSSASTTTDVTGNYSFGGLANGAYIVTPSDISYIFTLPSQNVTIAGNNVTGVNFSANNAPPIYSISGKITLPTSGIGATATVTVTLTLQSTGAVVSSTTANSSGSYSLTGIPNGSYVVTPTSPTALFTPASLTITISGSSNTTANFTAVGLVFYDDFTGTSLNPAWTVISRHGEYAQNETECNVPQMVSVANGLLTITTENTPNPDPLNLGTCGDFNPPTAPGVQPTVLTSPTSWPFVTGAIQWTNLTFTYGTVEIRAQFPAKTTKLWPATWMLGSNCQLSNIYTATTGYTYTTNTGTHTCPDLGTSGYTEQDLTECFGSTWCQYNAFNPGTTCQKSYSVDNNFHIFTTVWTPSTVTQSVDGVVVSSCNMVMSNPMFLIIQTQTGGVGGTPANLPATLNVDYVKVTQP